MAYLSADTFPSPTTYLGFELQAPRTWTYEDVSLTFSYNAQQDWTYTPVTG